MSPRVRTPVLLDQGPTHMTSFNLNSLHKTSISKYRHGGEWGFHRGIWRNTKFDYLYAGLVLP